MVGQQTTPDEGGLYPPPAYTTQAIDFGTNGSGVIEPRVYCFLIKPFATDEGGTH